MMSTFSVYADHTNNSLQFQTNNAERMRIDSSGNVDWDDFASAKVAPEWSGRKCPLDADKLNNRLNNQ